MSAANLIRELRSLGIAVWVADRRVGIAPANLMTPELRERVRAGRDELVAQLEADRASWWEQECGPTFLLHGEQLEPIVSTTCYACGGSEWWRLNGSCHWVCKACREPDPFADEIEVDDRLRARDEQRSRGGAANRPAVPCANCGGHERRPVGDAWACARCGRQPGRPS